MAEILLIQAPVPNPTIRDATRINCVLPLGLAYLAAVLLEDSFSVEALDLHASPLPADRLEESIRARCPRLVGISATTESSVNALRIAAASKRTVPDALVIAGGPHATFTANEILASGAVDVVVHREGELTLLELANHFLRGLGDIHDIQGISFAAQDGTFTSTPGRRFVEDLDDLPLPARHLFRNYEYTTHRDPIVTSRGCPHRCIFCSAGAMAGGRYRSRTAAGVMDEILFLKSQGRTQLNFSDDTMTANVPRLLRICRYIQALALSLDWVCESRVDVATADLLQRMKECGCSIIQFGVESGSQAVLDQIQKHITLDQVTSAVRSAAACGIRLILCSFMIGHPQDTEETIRNTVDFACGLARDYGAEIRLHVCTPYPGTPLFTSASQLGVHLASRNYSDYNFLSPVMDTPHLSHMQIRSLFVSASLEVINHMPPHVAREYAAHQRRLAASKEPKT